MFFAQKNYSKKDSITTSNSLEEVIVTATRTKRQLSSIPMPVTLVSKKQLEKTGAVRLRDILLEQTGIVMVSDVGNSEGVQMQGISADYTLILIDGVPIVGRTAGNIDLRRLSVNNVKQIEIVKGASSSLYGSEAIGGVINIITETPKKDGIEGNLSLLTRFGERNELDINTVTNYRKNNFGFITGINLNSSNGFDLSPETPSITAYPHQNITGDLKILYDFSDKVSALVSGRIYNQKMKNSYNKTDEQNDVNINTKITHKVTENLSIDYTFYATKYKAESFFNEGKTLFKRSLLRSEVRGKYDLENSNIILGIGSDFDALNRTAFDGNKRYKEFYTYTQYDTNITEKLNIILGARYENSNKYSSAFSPKISTSYTITNWLMVKASVGYGFKAPDFRQLFFNFRNTANGYIVLGTQTLYDLFPNTTGINVVRKELKPESSIGYNFGLQLKPITSLKVNLNLFRNDISDLIDTFDTRLNPIELDLPSGTRTFSYRNIADVYTQGIELEVNYKINKNFTFSSGYQFLDTGNKEEEKKIKNGEIFFRRTTTSPSERLTTNNYFGLVNRSKHSANAKLFYENFKHKFSANVRAVYRSKYGLYDTNNSQGILDNFDDFVSKNTQINIAANKSLLNRFITIQLGIDNIFNEKGEENKVNFNGADNVLRLGSTYYGRIKFNF